MSNEKAEERLKAGFKDWELPPEEPNKPGTPADGGQHARQEDIEWPTMDEAAYHGFAGKVIRTIEPHSESDPVALLLQLLVCTGNIIGRTRYVLTESDRHYPNLFAGIVGKTARARKGTALGRILAILDIANHLWADERIQGGLSSGEGLINVVRDPIMKWDKEKREWYEADHGIDDKRLLVIEPEFAGVCTVMERSGNTISPLLRKAWDGRKLQTMTRKDPLTATNAHISVIGHITLDELRARLTRNDMANGFANRFLFALSKRSKHLPFGGALDDEEIRKLGNELGDIIATVRGDPLSGLVPPERLTMTERAKEKWAPLYDDLAIGHPGLLGEITARAEPQVLRLSMIYALLDKSDQIDLPHLEAGLAVWNYCDASTTHIFGTALGDEVADTILRALKGAGNDGMTRSMIYDLYGGRQSRERISAALGLLLEKGWARTTMLTTGGRPTEMWFKK
jgi:hypothetical protein